MSLNLSDEDQIEYSKQHRELADLRDWYANAGDQKNAKKYRLAISALYTEYCAKQLPQLSQEPSNCAYPNCGYILTLT